MAAGQDAEAATAGEDVHLQENTGAGTEAHAEDRNLY